MASTPEQATAPQAPSDPAPVPTPEAAVLAADAPTAPAPKVRRRQPADRQESQVTGKSKAASSAKAENPAKAARSAKAVKQAKAPAAETAVKTPSKGVGKAAAKASRQSSAMPDAKAATKEAARSAAKSPAKSPAKAATKAARPASRKPAAPAAAEVKPAKQKLVRDSFTIPRVEYAMLDQLKQRAISLARAAKKSELLRAGIKLLSTLSDRAFAKALADVPTIKTGRPEKGKDKAAEPAHTAKAKAAKVDRAAR